MRVAIVGAGSVGATLGARLAASGHEVVLIARGAHLEAIRSDGLRLVDHVGNESGLHRRRRAPIRPTSAFRIWWSSD